MERRIGEIFEYQGEWYQCLEGKSCCECDLRNRICLRDTSAFPFEICAEAYRSDGKSVIFKKLEKLGEPFTDNGKLYQRYEVFDTDRTNARSGVSMYVPVGNEKFVCIEIKQKSYQYGT